VTTALMYHELEQPGRPLAGEGAGYVRYVLDESRFTQHMEWLTTAGLRGVAVGRAHANRFDAADQVVITFDDGCESDWIVAVPQLVKRGFGATFYVVSRWIERRPGFLRAAQLRDLAAAGFEVGSHSATHAFLTELDDTALDRELHDSRHEIEDIIGRPVTHLSCPGGRASRRVAEAARNAGYHTMATSRIGMNGPSTDPFALHRCALRRDTPQHTFEAFCRGHGLRNEQIRDYALTAAKALLGSRVYGSLRTIALRRT
jgi:peptidoglycan/xylan/chitin deacetylase (PgdA/CDA1 family)